MSDSIDTESLSSNTIKIKTVNSGQDKDYLESNSNSETNISIETLPNDDVVNDENLTNNDDNDNNVQLKRSEIAASHTNNAETEIVTTHPSDDELRKSSNLLDFGCRVNSAGSTLCDSNTAVNLLPSTSKSTGTNKKKHELRKYEEQLRCLIPGATDLSRFDLIHSAIDYISDLEEALQARARKVRHQQDSVPRTPFSQLPSQQGESFTFVQQRQPFAVIPNGTDEAEKPSEHSDSLKRLQNAFLQSPVVNEILTGRANGETTSNCFENQIDLLLNSNSSTQSLRLDSTGKINIDTDIQNSVIKQPTKPKSTGKCMENEDLVDKVCEENSSAVINHSSKRQKCEHSDSDS